MKIDWSISRFMHNRRAAHGPQLRQTKNLIQCGFDCFHHGSQRNLVPAENIKDICIREAAHVVVYEAMDAQFLVTRSHSFGVGAL